MYQTYLTYVNSGLLFIDASNSYISATADHPAPCGWKVWMILSNRLKYGVSSPGE
jgi:hypothetical protein